MLLNNAIKILNPMLGAVKEICDYNFLEKNGIITCNFIRLSPLEINSIDNFAIGYKIKAK